MNERRKIAILSAGRKVESTRRLEQVLRERGHRVRILAPDDLQIVVDAEDPVLLYKGKVLPRPDAVIPRIASSKSSLGTAIVAHLERMGVYCLNSAQAIQSSRNKLRALQRLSRHGLDLPKTVLLSAHARDLPAVLEQVGGVPVVIKLLEGTQGVGVMLANTVESATAILETLRKTGQEVLVQRFVAESRGRDIRALVVGGEVIATVRRVAQGNEFRSNVHRGAQAVAYEPGPEYLRTAVAAAQILGLAVAGVDMLEGAGGPVIMEVNSSPAIAGMEQAVGRDLATPIAELIESRVDHPPLDITQRLTRHPGYGVCELTVHARSPLIGQTLATSGLGDAELQVLCVRRGAEVVSVPGGSFVLAERDEVLVFGSLDAARGFLPKRGRRKRAT